MNFIKKIVDKNIDESVHLQFQKFSKGEFQNRAIINAKNSKGKYTISTTAEFANGMVKEVAEKLGEEITNVKGAVVSTSDLTGELDFNDKKQFQGVKRYMIENEMSGNEILNLLDKFPKAFFALSFETEKDETKLKIKPKAPKSGKPSSKDGERPKADFCKLVTKDADLAKNFIFEKPDFKKAEINHSYFIERMVIPEEVKDSKDFSAIRESAKRAGKILRMSFIDDVEMKKEIEFEA